MCEIQSHFSPHIMGRVKRIHFIGIGGIGMSGMAELLHKLGFNISGSDLKQTEITDNLQNLGIKIRPQIGIGYNL